MVSGGTPTSFYSELQTFFSSNSWRPYNLFPISKLLSKQIELRFVSLCSDCHHQVPFKALQEQLRPQLWIPASTTDQRTIPRTVLIYPTIQIPIEPCQTAILTSTTSCSLSRAVAMPPLTRARAQPAVNARAPLVRALRLGRGRDRRALAPPTTPLKGTLQQRKPQQRSVATATNREMMAKRKFVLSLVH